MNLSRYNMVSVIISIYSWSSILFLVPYSFSCLVLILSLFNFLFGSSYLPTLYPNASERTSLLRCYYFFKYYSFCLSFCHILSYSAFISSIFSVYLSAPSVTRYIFLFLLWSRYSILLIFYPRTCFIIDSGRWCLTLLRP